MHMIIHQRIQVFITLITQMLDTNNTQFLEMVYADMLRTQKFKYLYGQLHRFSVKLIFEHKYTQLELLL